MILELLPPPIIKLLKEIEELGFLLCLVGGAPRDFLILQKIGHDLDFEIRPLDKTIHNDQWNSYYKKLIDFFKINNLSFKELPYLITKVELDGYSLEFSSPRLEIPQLNNHTHHHFDAILDPSLTYDESFKRRDFTINAIGIIFEIATKQESWIDPYNGKIDIQNKILKNISEEFYLDSVRFLRLIRFSLKFSDFTIDQSLLANIKKMNLSDLSNYHFKSEFKKSQTINFLNQFKYFVTKNNLTLPNSFLIWTKYDFPSDIYNDLEILAYVYSQDITDLSDAEKVMSFFSMKEKCLPDLISYYQSYQMIKKISLEQWKLYGKMKFDDLLSTSLLKDLKNLEDKKEWHLNLKQKEQLLISWIDWENIKFSENEITEISFKNRSYYRYYKSLTRKFGNG